MMNNIATTKAESPLYYDPFMDSLNSLEFQEAIKKALETYKRRKISFAMLHVKFEFLKNIKPTTLLWQEMAKKMSQCLRKTDIISHLKENEFLLVILDVTKNEDAGTVANKILQAFKEPLTMDGQEIQTTLNIGISIYPEDGEEINILQKNADIAMYLANEQGKNNYQYADSSLSKKIQITISPEKNLQKAIANNELRLLYQPRIELKTGKVVGVEALLRWKNSRGEMVYPDEFIPLAEGTGDIIPLTEWVLKTACRQTKMWHSSGLTRLSVSVNFTARILKEKNFIRILETFLNNTGLHAKYLGLEISEHFLLEDINNSITFLKQLKNLGVLIGIDNVGTSRSSLGYLKLFNVDYVNIDRMFTRNVATDQNDASIIHGIIQMAHQLNIKTVGEGVETKDQFLVLQQAGCDIYQGYYLSKPIYPENVASFLETYQGLK